MGFSHQKIRLDLRGDLRSSSGYYTASLQPFYWDYKCGQTHAAPVPILYIIVRAEDDAAMKNELLVGHSALYWRLLGRTLILADRGTVTDAMPFEYGRLFGFTATAGTLSCGASSLLARLFLLLHCTTYKLPSQSLPSDAAAVRPFLDSWLQRRSDVGC
jgi:hypothetical protein